jgi:hypothetical protein
MCLRRRFLATASLAGVIAFSSALAGGPTFNGRDPATAALTTSAVAPAALVAADRKPLKIRTTLRGKKVLPHRIHWMARTSLGESAVSAVTFLIDGKVRWIEHRAPYTYGDDGNWLVTSWLAPGMHRFTARLLASDGRRAAATTRARVLPAPAPPSELNGTHWTRVYTKAETGDAPAGRWTLMIDATGWRIKDPEGTGAWIDVAYLEPGFLETRGGIWTRPHNPYEGQAWCENTNAPVRFRWKVNDDSLTFALAGPSRCDGFGPFMSKTWSRAR